MRSAGRRGSGGCRLWSRGRAPTLRRLTAWVESSDWAAFLPRVPETRSSTSICLKVVDPWFDSLDRSARTAVARRAAALLEEEGAALDVASYRDAPPGFRFWGGATVETDDLRAALPWLDWAYDRARAEAR